MAFTNYEVWSFQDMIDHLIDAMVSSDQSPRTVRTAKRAILDAYRDIANARNWTYFYRRGLVTTVAQQADGTLEYDHTGGSAERLVTLTDATVSSDVIYYELILEGIRYEIERYLSPTTFTLTERANPGADVAAGTSFTLVREQYPLWDDFRSLGRLVDVNATGRRLDYVSPQEFLEVSRIVRTASLPWQYTIMKNPKLAGGNVIAFAPAPSEARSYDLYGQFRPKPLRVAQESTGTISMTAGSTTVSGTTTAFTPDHVGCLLRVSPDAIDLPTGIIGSLDDRDNQAVFEGIVKRYVSASELELEQAPTEELSARKYTLSSRIDIESGSMLNYFKRLCESLFSQYDGRDDAQRRMELARVAFGEAAAADDREVGPQQPYYYGPVTLEDLAISVNP